MWGVSSVTYYRDEWYRSVKQNAKKQKENEMNYKEKKKREKTGYRNGKEGMITVVSWKWEKKEVKKDHRKYKKKTTPKKSGPS